jgi:formate hydrogenlyase subunit 3/multisubunit Na+/H+ antiporter MnhD subunit
MDLPTLLLVLAPGIPALLALLWPLERLRPVLVHLAPWAALPALGLALLPAPFEAALEIPALFTGVVLDLDGLGRAFLGFTAFLWIVAGAFARAYHADDERKESFFGFFTLTMAGNVGLIVAGDILTFYLFFACMTFAAYGMVIHTRDGEALRAGRIYIVLAVLGELAILTTLIALGWVTDGVPAFGPTLDVAWQRLDGFGYAGAVAALVVAGFGVKAGLVPLHLWLPLAHPVAPTAASALLSGAMIKAGLLAWLRFLPGVDALPTVGSALMVLGVVSAFYGVVVGLAQDDPKTVLAYSSVSQMGYMALGTGLLLSSPEWAPVAIVAVVFYAVHHGMAKGALFLAVGVGDRAPVGAGSGPWPKAILVGAAVPALALAGAPLTGGARAKGVLKNALAELAPGWYPVLDPILLVAAAGTTLLLARFLVTLKARMEPGPVVAGTGHGGRRAPWGLVIPWGALVAAGAAALVWLPAAYPPPVGVEVPGALYGLGSALGPVVAGGAVAWVVWRRPDLLGSWRGFRVPAGDLVVPIESLARGLIRIRLEAGVNRISAELRQLRRTQLWSHVRAAWVAERDLYLARGPVVAVLLLVLAAALGVLAGAAGGVLP